MTARASPTMQAGHVGEVLKASYAHLIVDEYQDCSVPQHYLVYFLSLILPTCVLGDPMQGIFGFGGNALANWEQQVCAHFPVVAELRPFLPTTTSSDWLRRGHCRPPPTVVC